MSLPTDKKMTATFQSGLATMKRQTPHGNILTSSQRNTTRLPQSLTAISQQVGFSLKKRTITPPRSTWKTPSLLQRPSPDRAGTPTSHVSRPKTGIVKKNVSETMALIKNECEEKKKSNRRSKSNSKTQITPPDISSAPQESNHFPKKIELRPSLLMSIANLPSQNLEHLAWNISHGKMTANVSQVSTNTMKHEESKRTKQISEPESSREISSDAISLDSSNRNDQTRTIKVIKRTTKPVAVEQFYKEKNSCTVKGGDVITIAGGMSNTGVTVASVNVTTVSKAQTELKQQPNDGKKNNSLIRQYEEIKNRSANLIDANWKLNPTEKEKGVNNKSNGKENLSIPVKVNCISDSIPVEVSSKENLNSRNKNDTSKTMNTSNVGSLLAKVKKTKASMIGTGTGTRENKFSDIKDFREMASSSPFIRKKSKDTEKNQHNASVVANTDKKINFTIQTKNNSNSNSNSNSEQIVSIPGNRNNISLLSTINQQQTPSVNGKGSSQMNTKSDSIFQPSSSSAYNTIGPASEEQCKKIVQIKEFTEIGSVSGTPKKVNQDNYFIFHCLNDDPSCFYFGVCDGHGMNGHDVSSYLRENLPLTLNNSLKKNKKSINDCKIQKVLEDSFLSINSRLFNEATLDTNFSGSTCVSVIVTNEKVICANVGDSRAVMGRYVNGTWSSVNLSRDHKPSENDEAQRIKKRGGRIEAFIDEEEGPIGPLRVWLKEEAIPGLAMTRSFGDQLAASVGVIADPEIKEFKLSSEDKFMILASDGIWEFISSEESVDLVKDFYMKSDISGACKFLYTEASKRWLSIEDAIDDITALLVFFD